MKNIKRLLLVGSLALTLMAAIAITIVTATGQTLKPVTLNAGDNITVNCNNGKILVTNSNEGVTLKCAGAPVIEGFVGVSEGASLLGTVNIEVKVQSGSSPISLVIFDLFQGTKRLDSRNEASPPYFYYGANQGKPNGWDTTKLPDGDYSLLVTANSTDGQSSNARINFIIKNAALPPATTTPPATTDKGVCGESSEMWHPPVVTGTDGKPCNTGHEHGDEPPKWISDAGYMVMFHGHFSTSPLENTAKHAAMKGFSTRFGDTDVYFRIHAASNPLDHSARYHSYEVWARDSSGAVSHWQGWNNTGDPITDRIVRRQGVESSVRPIMLVVDQTSLAQGIGCEQWYSTTARWSWDFGWTICGATTFYTPGENTTASDQSTWKLTGSLGGTRRLEAAWYIFRAHPTGKFYATQFGDIVSGLNDAKCSATSVKYGVTYQNVCLEQYIAPTMKQVSFPNNAIQKDFDVTGVKIPN
ncbi:hypothetical protein [Candidatus Chlorohelix sp.]|uniref:hypothetical protein n=1 Tax=Candidatus Chlorohelix sp. TaxID=3139201 RepID=UPI003061482E